jgi:RHS repeat-associated protein
LYTYRRGGDGQRATKQLGAGVTTYYLRGLGQVLSEFEEEGAQARWTIDYVSLGARLLAGLRPVTGTATLTLRVVGAGAGTVSSSPQGTSCGTDCQSFATGTVIALSATPGAGLVFAGWSGDADCADGVVTLGRPVACYATFAATLPVFRKVAPAPYGSVTNGSAQLAWNGVPGASYLVCWDTTNNDACDTAWVPVGGLTSHVIEALATGTYYWQVKTAGEGAVEADAGTWWPFTVAVPAIPPDHWTAEYYPNPTLTAPAASTVDDGAGFLQHDWGSGSPAGVPPGDWSARYTRTITLTAPARYRFFVLTDDGARLWVDGALVIDAWRAMTGPTIFTTVQDLGAGSHTLRLEYSNGDGPASVRLAWQDMATAILGPAEALRPGDVKTSADGRYTVTYQGDANLVVRRQNGAVAWATETAGAGTALQVALQYDGNLVLYVDEWVPAWDTNTAGNPGAWLALADDALTLRSPEGDAIWTVPLGVPLLTKTTPAAGATVTGSAVTFAWTAVAGETYRVCWDTSNNGTCNGTWVDAGGATTLTVTGVAPGTYWWQVKTVGGGVEADHGAWRPLTTVAAPSFGKLAPPTGTTGLGNDVTLQWTAVPDEGYWVCWDTVNNATCDTMWWPNGGATAKLLSNLAPATYYWQVRTAGSGLEADGGAWWSFTVTTPLVPADHWKAEYFGNQELTGAPAAVVDEGTGFVDHSWGDGGPAGLADHFSARFTRAVTLAAGRYRFTVTTDDGSRLWVDNQLTVDAWWTQPPTGYTTEVDLGAGEHTLRYEYFEQAGGATAHLTWTPVLEVPAGVWTAEYYANMTLSGSPASTVEEVSAFIDHPWGDGGPENLPVDGFSARFTRTLAFPAGTYRFTLTTDDGSRLWVDDQVVIDAWWDQAPSTYTADVALAAGDHAVRYEFYENGGGATAQLSWAFAPAPEAGAASALTRPRGPFDGVLVGRPTAAATAKAAVVALFALAALGGCRRRDRRVGARVPATALLLTAMLLLPATALAHIPTQVVEYYHTDALGSVRAVTKQVNGEWQVVARHDFMPFGEEVAPPPPPSGKRLFTGKERDSETGMDYFEARYLGASSGRFTSPDPMSASAQRMVNPQMWNMYTYVANRPLTAIDPLGMELVPLGQHSDEEIDERSSYLKRQLKAKGISKSDRATIKAELATLALEMEGNRIVGEMLAALASKNQLNGMKLSNFTLTTETSSDFAGVLRRDQLAEVAAKDAFVLQGRDGPFKGTIFIRTEPPDGFYRQSQSDSDYVYYGATALRHEQRHFMVPGHEVEALTLQLSVLQIFQNDFRSRGTYDSLTAFLLREISRNR